MNIKNNSHKIYITGDTHGLTDIDKIYTFRDKYGKKLTKDDYLIVAGDFGCCWFGNPEPGTEWYEMLKFEGLLDLDDRVTKFWDSCPWTTLFVDGNHENHPLLNSYPVTEWHGGKVHVISDSIIHLMRGQIYEIGGFSFFTLGGADSIDKYNRTIGKSWWAEELPFKEEYDEAMSNLEKHDMAVDYVITHCCGTSLLPMLCTFHFEEDELTRFFDHLEFDFGLNFKHWYFGHHHWDKKIVDKHTCLYEKIERIL